VLTTGIYCRPSCAARHPKRENVRFFLNGSEAAATGLRACLRCRPDEVSRDAAALDRVYQLLESADQPPSLGALAEAAGLKICIHSSFTSGITTCAEHQIALAIPNLDDGNQIMWQLLREDIVASPDLIPVKGWMNAISGPGLGCELNRTVMAEAGKNYTTAKN